MKTLRAIGLVALALLAPLFAVAQGQYGGPAAHWYFAIDYATSNIQGQGSNQFTWNLGSTGPGSCIANPSGPGNPFFIFGPSTAPFPEYIQDYTASNSEIVTPSSTSITGSTCGFTASPSHTHTTFWVKSGSCGLYEAINGNQNSPYPVTIFVDAAWKTCAASLPTTQTLGAILAAMPTSYGSSNVSIVRSYTTPWTVYSWNGLTYNSNGGGPPTAAFGAAAGTTPSGLLATGPGNNVTVSLTAGTTGTPTTTGTLFTLTYPSGTTSDGFNHQPTCTVHSIGANSYTVGTTTYSGSASNGYVVTVVANGSSALTAATFYTFSVTCY